MNIFMKKLPIIKDKHIKLNIGCGKDKYKGFIGIDIRDCGQEIIWDVRDGIPFPNESVEFIFSSHVMEHFDNEESEEVLREIYRVLEKGGIFQCIIPHALDPTAFYFDHKTFWNEERVQTLPGVPGLEGFKIIKNEISTKLNTRSRMELYFELKKV